jgi:Rieske Fe-S protein
MGEMTRRDAMRLSAGALAVFGPAGCAADHVEGRPSGGGKTSPSDEPSTPPSRRELAAVADIPEGEAFDVSATAGEPAYLIRNGQSIRLVSATCTHASCRVEWQPSDRNFQCPCHRGRYDIDGQVVSGPPPRALEELRVVVETGTVFLDR